MHQSLLPAKPGSVWAGAILADYSTSVLIFTRLDVLLHLLHLLHSCGLFWERQLRPGVSFQEQSLKCLGINKWTNSHMDGLLCLRVPNSWYRGKFASSIPVRNQLAYFSSPQGWWIHFCTEGSWAEWAHTLAAPEACSAGANSIQESWSPTFRILVHESTEHEEPFRNSKEHALVTFLLHAAVTLISLVSLVFCLAFRMTAPSQGLMQSIISSPRFLPLPVNSSEAHTNAFSAM